MYFINTLQLEKELRNDEVRENEQVKYLLTLMVLVMFSQMNYLYGTDVNMAVIKTFITIAVCFVGILICYFINKWGDGKDFIKKFVCLSVPVLVKIYLITFLLLFVLFILFKMTGDEQSIKEMTSSEPEDKSTVLAGLLFFQVIAFTWLGIRFMKVNKSDSVEDFKECPECAEKIRLKAKVCRFCGYKMGEG